MTVSVAAAILTVAYFPVLAPRLHTRPGTSHFGAVHSGDRAQLNFVVQNLHPWPVTVTGMKGSCGCTQAFPGRKLPFQLRPLETASVTVALDTEGKTGPVTQQVWVQTHDSKRGTPLTITGTVVPRTH
jgi:hypothetical protein